MAAKARSILLLLAACCSLFAHIPRTSSVGQNSHPGLEPFALPSHPAPPAVNSLIATGFCECLYDEGKRSRSTGKERDAETGLDYFGARYLSAAQGRFTSPDPKLYPDAVLDSQSWNKYAYVRNNPMRLVDPDGLDWVDKTLGFFNALASNALGGLLRADGNKDFKQGQQDGDVASLLVASEEAKAGGAMMGGGGAACATGGGCVAGAPAAATGFALAGHAVVMGASAAKNLAANAERRANDFTPGEKKKIDANNAQQNGGVNKCENCDRALEKVQSKPGVPTPGNQLQRHHKKPAAQGGAGKAENAKVLCPDCHIKEHRKLRAKGGQ
jgi:RHS repeat-associated protein